MKIEDLIVDLSRSLEPVDPLPRPLLRMVRWTLLSLAITTAGVLLIGPRVDIEEAMHEPLFATLAVLTLTTAITSVAIALVLAIPGAERSPWQRGVPIGAAVAWLGVLIAFLADESAPLSRLLSFPVHPACIVEIAALSLVPALAVFDMLRRAAPLQVGWAAAFAALGALSVGALGTQILCPVDDPAHQLVGHVTPMILMAVGVVLAAWRSLVWWSDRTP